MERYEIECWLKSMDRKKYKVDKPEERDFFQAIECLESLLNEKSYDDGKEEGHGEGYDEGHGEGYDEGHGEGYDEGHGEGYDEGHSDGRQVGYDDGLRDGKWKREKCKPVETGEEEMHFDCSLCEGDTIQKDFNFCPGCGAEIDW
jgi:flagellar biosynthesis/type III secretory pathway protein FliH